MIMALCTWLIYAQAQSGEITVDTLGKLEPNLAGNLVAICSSGIIHAVFSLAKPQNYDFKSMAEIEMLEDDQRGLNEADFTDKFLAEAKAWIQKWGWTFSIIMVVIWPLLSLPAETFSKDYFAFWVFLSLAWSFVATFVIIALPIQESWDSIVGIVFALLGMQRPEKQVEVPTTKPAETDEQRDKDVQVSI